MNLNRREAIFALGGLATIPFIPAEKKQNRIFWATKKFQIHDDRSNCASCSITSNKQTCVRQVFRPKLSELKEDHWFCYELGGTRWWIPFNQHDNCKLQIQGIMRASKYYYPNAKKYHQVIVYHPNDPNLLGCEMFIDGKMKSEIMARNWEFLLYDPRSKFKFGV